MKVLFFTIVLDGMPFITWHLPMMNRLKFDWDWYVMEGVALPNHCTRWCKAIPPRLSKDGTAEYLESIAGHPRVHVASKPSWDGKLEMVNVAADALTEPSLVIQIDSDEIWQSGQIETIRSLFMRRPDRNAALFTCRYFVGQNIVVKGRGGYGNRDGEWLRAFRMGPGMRFSRHEPPRIADFEVASFTPEETEAMGLVFDHYAYATRKAVVFKERYYGYAGAAQNWDRLQANTKWPAKLRNFLPWVKDESEVVALHERRQS